MGITGKYRHYKGNEYKVLGEGIHTETEERFVVYQALSNPANIWIRPYSMFFESVIIDGQEISRFTKVED